MNNNRYFQFHKLKFLRKLKIDAIPVFPKNTRNPFWKTVILVAFIFLYQPVQSRIIVVRPGNDLNTIVNNTVEGDTVLIKPGTYGKIFLQEKKFTEQKPLVIKALGPEATIISGDSISGGRSLEVSHCSFVVIDGLTFTNSLWGIYVKNSNHIILINNEIHHTGQEGCHIGRSSKYVDVTGNKIYHTGLFNPKWGEGIYVGSGSYYRQNTFPDNCEYIWIEGNHIYETGKAEGINIKGESFHVTIRSNNIHNIRPGTSEQYNQAAITIEGCENSLNNNYRVTEPRDIWVEGNTIKNVSGGHLDWNNGIMFFGTGVYILNNTISNCTNRGIFGSNWKNPGLENHVFGNIISGCGISIEIQPEVKTSLTDPGNNPHSPQKWYKGSR